MLICQSAFGCLHAFQALVSAVLAGTAALVSAYVIWKSARLTDTREREHEDSQQRRRLTFVANLLSIEVQTIASRTRAIQGTIRVVRAANKELTKRGAECCRLYLPGDVDDWEKIGLLPTRIQQELFGFRRLLNQHNGDMLEGNTFGSDQAWEQANRHLSLIATEGTKLVGALMLLSKDADRSDLP
jgi:hypothetical protein